MPSEYLDRIKKALKITYNHADSDITNKITSCMAKIKKWLGGYQFIYDAKDSVDISVNDLLENYVRYEWNDSGQYFESDYRSDIISCQLEVAKRAYKKNR